MEIYKVLLSRPVEKELLRLPRHIVLKLAAWIDDIGFLGLSEVRKLPGYHDEPLKGQRKGQRSVRLSKHYRAIYVVEEAVALIKIVEVNEHDY